MDLEKARAFIKDNHRAVMATYRRDGRPQLSPVAVGLDGQGYPVISSRETAYKVRNLQRDPRVSLCVFVDKFFGEWIQIDGTAEQGDMRRLVFFCCKAPRGIYTR